MVQEAVDAIYDIFWRDAINGELGPDARRCWFSDNAEVVYRVRSAQRLARGCLEVIVASLAHSSHFVRSMEAGAAELDMPGKAADHHDRAYRQRFRQHPPLGCCVLLFRLAGLLFFAVL